MSVKSHQTLNAVSKIICECTKDVLDSVTGKNISFAKTIQKVPVIHLRPDIGCFVLFSGDYSGLMIMNFTAESAMSIYKNQMMQMGIPEEELAIEYTADDVVDSIGEIINQIIGSVRRRIEDQYELVATNTQPKAIALTTSIILTIDAPEVEKDLCRKLSFKIEGQPFHIEVSMEKTEFISLEGKNVHDRAEGEAPMSSKDITMESYQKVAENRINTPEKPAGNQDIDFDALLKNNT
jgi:CheY-specific phosphatase CheX